MEVYSRNFVKKQFEVRKFELKVIKLSLELSLENMR